MYVLQNAYIAPRRGYMWSRGGVVVSPLACHAGRVQSHVWKARLQSVKTWLSMKKCYTRTEHYYHLLLLLLLLLYTRHYFPAIAA